MQKGFSLTAAMLALCLFVPAEGQPRDYYVSPSGFDSNKGTSPASAWKSIARVNQVNFAPGDRVFFQGGAAFKGVIYLDANDKATPTNPLTVGSYGAGRATIHGGAGNGLVAYNCGGIRITNLRFVGQERTTNGADGILFYNDLPGDVKLSFVRIDNVEVSGFGKFGITIGAWNGQSGYRDVRVTRTLLHDNALAGLITYAETPNVHEKVYVGYTKAYDNPGLPGWPTNTGSGIVLGSVNHGVIERCVAHDNGSLCDANEGGVGIWAYDSTDVIIQHNESYNNRTNGPADGGGFDFDRNVSNSVMQYNYSHGNDGAGYLLCHIPGDDNFAGNVVRYNISENDGRKNGYGAISLYGTVRDTQIYNNTVFVGPEHAEGNPPALLIRGSTENVFVRNNIFQTAGGLGLVDCPGGEGVFFQGNNYFSSGDAFVIDFAGTTYRSFKTWRHFTGQEFLNGVFLGSSVDPQLTGPGRGQTFNDAALLPALDAYRLRPTSPLSGAGLDSLRLFGVHPGMQDYYGTRLSPDMRYAVGAHQAVQP